MQKLKFFLFLIIVLIGAISVDFASAGNINEIPTCQQELEFSPYYHYPYDDLHLILENKGIDAIKIFSYGSLMDNQSASKTLSPKTMETLKPAVAFGVKRIFNRDVAIKPNSKWGIPNNSDARGMLNLNLSENPDDLVNGIVFEVDRNDIPNLLYREVGYDLIPVIVRDWDEATKKDKAKCYIAYTFYAPPDSSFTSDYIDPRPNYYELSRDASKNYGPVFYFLWFSTTYLSDGITPIIEWEKLVQNNETLTQTQ